MWYLNLLIRRRLAELSALGDTENPSDIEVLSQFGNRRLFPSQYFTEEESSEWRHDVGTGYTRVNNKLEITTEAGERLRFTIGPNCRIQKKKFELLQIIHVYSTVRSGQLPRAEVVVTEELNTLVQPYQSVSIRAAALVEIFELEKEEKTVLIRFLTEPGWGQAMLGAVSFLATKALGGYSMDDELCIRKGVQEYNRRREQGGAVDVDVLLSLMDVQRVKEMLYLREEEMIKEDARWANPMLDYLALWGVLRGVSVWENPTGVLLLKQWQHNLEMLAQGMNRFCTAKKIDSIVDELLVELKAASDQECSVPELFFLELVKVTKLWDDTLYRILAGVFRESISTVALRRLPQLLRGPNGEELRHYLMEQVKKGVLLGVEPDYVYALAGVYIWDAVHRGQDPVWTAQQNLLTRPNTEQALISMAVLSLAAWNRRMGNWLPMPKQLHAGRFTGLERTIYLYLAYPQKWSYRYAVNFYEDMLFNRLVCRETVEKKKVISAALAALEDAETQVAGERLLSLLSRRIPDVTENIRVRYRGVLDAAYKKKDAMSVVQSFRVCKNLGCFDKKTEIEQFRRMLAFLSSFELDFGLPEKDRLHPDVYSYLKLTCWELCLVYRESFTETSLKALEVLRKPEEDFLAYFNGIWNRIKDVPQTEYIMKDECEVAAFLSLLRQEEFSIIENNERILMLKQLAARSRIDTKLGPLLIRKWFKYVLCRFDLGEQAVKFYLAHRELDRPYLLYLTQMHHEDEEGFLISDLKRFFESKSRLGEGLYYADELGNCNVLKAFRMAKKQGLLERWITIPVERTLIDRNFLYRQVRVIGHYNADLPNDKLAMDYSYDDLGVVEAFVKEFPEKKHVFRELGYDAVLPSLEG